MYRIYLLGYGCIYDSNVPYDHSRMIYKPTLEQEENSAGSLKFTISPGMSGYDRLKLLRGYLCVTQYNRVKNKEEIIWAGRVLDDDRDVYNSRELECEGALAFLNDTIQPNSIVKGQSDKEHFSDIIAFHNVLMENDHNRQFDISEMLERNSYLDTIDNKLRVESGPELSEIIQIRKNESTLDIIKEQFLDKWGGYIKLTYDVVRVSSQSSDDSQAEIPFSDPEAILRIKMDYIDVYDLSMNPQVRQPIRFGENLVSLSRKASAEDFATVLYPKGGQLDDRMKAWPIRKHIANDYYRFFNNSPTSYEDIYYTYGYRIDSEDGMFRRTADLNFVIVQFVPCQPGDRFFLTTYIRGVPLSESSDGRTGLGAAAYAIHKSDMKTAVQIGNSVKNHLDNDTNAEIINDAQLELTEIEIPEEGAYLTVGLYYPNRMAIPFELRKFNPEYAEENLSIMTIPEHTPEVDTDGTYNDPISKTSSFDLYYDTYPSATGSNEKYENFFDSRTVKNQELINQFGYIYKEFEVYDPYLSAEYIFNEAVTELKKMREKIELEVEAVDLGIIASRYEPFKLLDSVHVNSSPHSLDEILPILKISLPLYAPEEAIYTLNNNVKTQTGMPSYMSLYVSDMYKKGRG